MNSTISLNSSVLVPFWVVIEYLGCNIGDPFVRCKILAIRDSDNIQVCDLELGKPNLIAYDVPTSFLIPEAEIEDWKRKIADWFLNYQAYH